MKKSEREKLKKLKKSQRVESINNIRKELISKGYEETEYTFYSTKQKLFSLLISAPISILFYYLFYLKNGFSDSFSYPWSYLYIFLIIYLRYFYIILQGFIWSIFCKNGLKDIHIHFETMKNWNGNGSYCYCMQTLNFKQYLVGLLMPLIFGLGAYLIAFFTKSFYIFLCSILIIIQESDDIILSAYIIKNKDCVFVKIPNECGLWAYKNIENSEK